MAGDLSFLLTVLLNFQRVEVDHKSKLYFYYSFSGQQLRANINSLLADCSERFN